MLRREFLSNLGIAGALGTTNLKPLKYSKQPKSALPDLPVEVVDIGDLDYINNVVQCCSTHACREFLFLQLEMRLKQEIAYHEQWSRWLGKPKTTLYVDKKSWDNIEIYEDNWQKEYILWSSIGKSRFYYYLITEYPNNIKVKTCEVNFMLVPTNGWNNCKEINVHKNDIVYKCDTKHHFGEILWYLENNKFHSLDILRIDSSHNFFPLLYQKNEEKYDIYWDTKKLIGEKITSIPVESNIPDTEDWWRQNCRKYYNYYA